MEKRVRDKLEKGEVSGFAAFGMYKELKRVTARLLKMEKEVKELKQQK